jgi:hypothetical protein
MVAKCLDHFLISHDFPTGPWVLKYKVLVGGLLEHMWITLEDASKGPKPPAPFKFNQRWIFEHDYKCLIRYVWKPLKINVERSYMFQFVEILARFKKEYIACDKNHNAKDKELFSSVEVKL